MNLSVLIPPLLIAAAGVGALFGMALNLRKARTIEDTPPAKIRSAAQGYTALNGFTRLIDTELRAPLTGIPCVWYRYTIERYERGRKNSRWNTIERGTSDQLFALDDNTGRCHIDPRHAEVTAAIKQCWEGSTPQPNGIVKHNVFDNFLGVQRFRYTEYRIHPDEWIYVLGWFETLHAPSLQERSIAQTKQLLNRWKQNRDALLARFDRNRDGDIDLHEWETARTTATREAKSLIASQPEPPPLNVISSPPLGDHPFLIASKDPRALAHRYRRNAVLSLIIGAALAAYGYWNFYGG